MEEAGDAEEEEVGDEVWTELDGEWGEVAEALGDSRSPPRPPSLSREVGSILTSPGGWRGETRPITPPWGSGVGRVTPPMRAE
jgi:hypothetical protein